MRSAEGAMKDTERRPERAPNTLKRWRSDAIRASCYVIFGLNEAFFRRKWLRGRELPLWWVPTINKPNVRKDLRPIMVGGLDPGRRNGFPQIGYGRALNRKIFRLI